MGLPFDSNLSTSLKHRVGGPHPSCSRSIRVPLSRGCNRSRASAIKCGTSLAALIVAVAVAGGATQTLVPRAYAMPAPEVEYVYDVMVRRHYNFANPDEAIKYGYGICDKVSQGEGYAQVMSDVKTDVLPNDEFAANYLVSYAVNLLCPAEIWQLRNSAAGYQSPAG